MAGRFREAKMRIDEANEPDPFTIVVDGVAHPKELYHSRLMTEWVQRLDPDADEAQLLAARAHHLRRWTIARDSYPEGRAGYLKWRTALKKQHAEDVASLLGKAGYDGETIERVQRIIRKDGLGRDGADPAVQTHEDALCIVFLATQLDELVDKLHDDDKIVDILRKSAGKMSAHGLAAAGGLKLSARGRALLERALAPPT